MKVRKTGAGLPDRIDIQMTPMIDIVFQLLTFFIMTFKIVTPEGDFNIKMPMSAPNPGPPDESLITKVKVTMTADPGSGELTSVTVGDVVLSPPYSVSLRNKVRSLVGDGGPSGAVEDTEVELDCAYDLKYQYVIMAITAVSGYITADKHVVKLVEKIKFSPPKKPG